ncbi:unnamed protein product, partial [Vitis vinifera]
MASWGSKVAALLILLNIFFFSCVSCNGVPCPPSTPPAPTKSAKCPKDTLKFGACANWLGLVGEVVGTPPSSKCCALVAGLADLEAALCFCTAIKANVLGAIKVEVPVALTLLVNACGKKVPEGFVCA